MESNHPLFQTRSGIEAAGGPASRPMTGTRLQVSYEPAANTPPDIVEIRIVCAEPTAAEMAELERLRIAIGNGLVIDRADRRRTLTNMPAQRAA